jgi:hypothetical protein
MAGRTVIQWDKDDLESLGMLCTTQLIGDNTIQAGAC